PFHDRIHRTGLLAQAAVDALDHVDVVARSAPCTVVAPRSCFDGNGLRRTDRLAQLASDAALFPIGVAAQHVLAAKARRNWALLKRIIEGRFGFEEIAHGEEKPRYELSQKH